MPHQKTPSYPFKGKTDERTDVSAELMNSWSIFFSSTYRYSLFLQHSVSFHIIPFFSLPKFFHPQSVCLYWLFYFVRFTFPLFAQIPPPLFFQPSAGWQKAWQPNIKKTHSCVFSSIPRGLSDCKSKLARAQSTIAGAVRVCVCGCTLSLAALMFLRWLTVRGPNRVEEKALQFSACLRSFLSWLSFFHFAPLPSPSLSLSPHLPSPRHPFLLRRLCPKFASRFPSMLFFRIWQLDSKICLNCGERLKLYFDIFPVPVCVFIWMCACVCVCACARVRVSRASSYFIFERLQTNQR